MAGGKNAAVVSALLMVGLALAFGSSTLAQTGRRTPQPSGGGRPTVEGRGGGSAVTPIAPGGIQVTRSTPGFERTPVAITPQPRLTVTIPAAMPALDSFDTSQLPFEFNATITAPQSSQEAYTAVVTFAAEHLSLGVAPLYAGELTDTQSGSTQMSAEAQAAIDEILAQYPDEVQAMLDWAATISGDGYWGVFSNGAAVVYVGDCSTNPNCAVTIDTLQIQIETASLGVYGIYAPGSAPASPEAALSLITATFPGLAGYTFTQSASEYGYAFTSYTYSVGQGASAVLKVAYAGVIPYSGQSLVYALVAVGDGYVSLVAR